MIKQQKQSDNENLKMTSEEVSKIVDHQSIRSNTDVEMIKDNTDNEDAEIDDPDLLSKKNLTTKYTPLSIIEALKGKHKNVNITEESQTYKQPISN